MRPTAKFRSQREYVRFALVAGLTLLAIGVALGFVAGRDTNGKIAMIAVVLAVAGLCVGFVAVIVGSFGTIARFLSRLR
ncbi:MAG: hypothetical protein ABI035_13485 [Gemmatimonadaceae bacterium]